MFQKPGDPVELAVSLVNTWDALEPEPELLRDLTVLRRFLERHGFREAAVSAVERDLGRVRALRDRLRAAFEVPDEETAVELLNELLRDTGATPQLERAGRAWRIRYLPAGAAVSSVLGALSAMSLLEAIRDDGWERFGVCAAAPCCCVFVDRSRNRSRRYCSALCADRVTQAAYRRRRRERARRDGFGKPSRRAERPP